MGVDARWKRNEIFENLNFGIHLLMIRIDVPTKCGHFQNLERWTRFSP